MDPDTILKQIRRDETRHPMTATLLTGPDYPDGGTGNVPPAPVTISIGHPARETPDGDFYCPVDILNEDGSLRFATVAFGFSEVQALHLALDRVGLVLGISRE